MSDFVSRLCFWFRASCTCACQPGTGAELLSSKLNKMFFGDTLIQKTYFLDNKNYKKIQGDLIDILAIKKALNRTTAVQLASQTW